MGGKASSIEEFTPPSFVIIFLEFTHIQSGPALVLLAEEVMSEQANTELIQSLYDAFGRGDVPFILDQLASDVEWVFEGPATVPYCGRRHGAKEVVGFFEALGGQDNRKLTIEHTVAQGDRVATFGRYAGTVRATGKSFDSSVAHLFIVRNGKVQLFLDFGDTAAMAAAYQGAAAATH